MILLDLEVKGFVISPEGRKLIDEAFGGRLPVSIKISLGETELASGDIWVQSVSLEWPYPDLQRISIEGQT